MSQSSLVAIRARHEIFEDHAAGIIRIVVSGFFDLGSLDAHFTEKSNVVRRWRASGRAVRILIDARELMPHSPEGQARTQEACDAIYRVGDRVAVLVDSFLAKRQMRRSIPLDGVIAFYVSETAARAWLCGVTRPSVSPDAHQGARGG